MEDRPRRRRDASRPPHRSAGSDCVSNLVQIHATAADICDECGRDDGAHLGLPKKPLTDGPTSSVPKPRPRNEAARPYPISITPSPFAGPCVPQSPMILPSSITIHPAGRPYLTAPDPPSTVSSCGHPSAGLRELRSPLTTAPAVWASNGSSVRFGVDSCTKDDTTPRMPLKSVLA